MERDFNFRNCLSSLKQYRMSFQHANNSGNCFVDNFLPSFKNSTLNMIATNFSSCFKVLFGDALMNDVLKVFSEMERIFEQLSPQDRIGEQMSIEKEKEMFNCLMLFYKTLLEYHRRGFRELNAAFQTLSSQNTLPDFFCEMFQDLKCETATETSNGPGKIIKKKALINKEPSKPSSKTSPKQVFKESFFTVSDRKASEEESRSTFYVPPPPGTTLGNENTIYGAGSPNTVELENKCVDDGVNFCNRKEIQVIEKQSAIPMQENKTSDCLLNSKGCHIASEEELDSVLDLLSGFGSQSSKMQSIPEGGISITVPPPPLPSSFSNQPVQGNIVDSPMMQGTDNKGCFQYPPFDGMNNSAYNNNFGRNTWPSQHRSSLPSGSLILPPVPFEGPPQHAGYFSNATGVNMRYPHDMQCAPPPYLVPPPPLGMGPPAGSGSVMSDVNWSYSDNKLNKTWPSNYASNKSTDFVNNPSNWMGVHDSSDGSDDSSNGDQQCMAVGLDLVHAIDSKDNSSDEDLTRNSANRSAPELKHRSMEDLLDSKGVNTWTSKQPWSQAGIPPYPPNCVDSRHMTNPLHKPLQMQWSDPMSSRNVWPQGLGQPSLPNSHSAQSFLPSHQNL